MRTYESKQKKWSTDVLKLDLKDRTGPKLVGFTTLSAGIFLSLQQKQSLSRQHCVPDVADIESDKHNRQ